MWYQTSKTFFYLTKRCEVSIQNVKNTRGGSKTHNVCNFNDIQSNPY